MGALSRIRAYVTISLCASVGADKHFARLATPLTPLSNSGKERNLFSHLGIRDSVPPPLTVLNKFAAHSVLKPTHIRMGWY